MYRSIVRGTGRTPSSKQRAVHQVSLGPVTDTESATAAGLRGLSATGGLELVDEQQCLQRMVATYLDDQLSPAEERMPGVLSRERHPAQRPLPRVVRNKNGHRRPERRAGAPGFNASN